jgi:hypothetical protein
VTSNVDDSCAADHASANPIGTLVSDTGVQPFSLTGSGITTGGNLREVVYREMAGTLDFYFQFQTTSGTALSSISNANTGNFAGFTTEAGTVSAIQLLSGQGSAGPVFDTRSANGDTIEWSYLSGVGAGTTSLTMAISTNATLDEASNIGLLGAGGGTETLNGFEPGGAGRAPIPEPASILLLGTGLGLVAASTRLRRRLKKQSGAGDGNRTRNEQLSPF